VSDVAITREPLDSLGSFRTTDGRFEAICWTHRGEGWSIYDDLSRRYHGAPNKREAERVIRQLYAGQEATRFPGYV
jgi:hypothetical protein